MLGLITYSLILLALAVGVWLRPAVGAAAVLCLYGLKQWGQSSTTLLSDYRQFTNYAVFVIALIGLIRAARKRSCIFCRVPSTSWLILALLAYALLSLIWAPDMEKSFEQWVIQGPYIVTITLLAPLLFSELKDVRIAFIWTAVTGGALCILALAFGKWGARGLLLYGDINESETNPLALSSLAGTVFLICALSLGRPNRMLMRVFAMGCIPITLAVILKSGSRGQLIGSAVGAIVSLPIAFRIKDVRSIAGLILVAALILGLGSWGASLVEIDTARWQGNDSKSAVAGRFENAQRILEVATSSVMTSVFGLGNSSSFQIIGGYPHITGLEVLAEEGIVGAAMYFAIIIFAIRSVSRISRQPELSDSNRSALAMLAGLFIFELILSWKQGTLLSSVYVFLYAIILARLEKPAGASVSRGLAPRANAPELIRFQNLLR
jgi:hypothetical protein